MEKDIFVELNFLIMIIDDALPKFDLPVDFVTDDSITGDILNQYGHFPCHIKAGVFVLCTRGTVRATINLSEYTITHNDFVTVLPGSFIQIHEVSSDTRVCFAGFSSEFISRVSYVETYLDFLPMILDNPIMTLQEEVAQLYRNAFSLLIRAYSLPNTLDNKEILMSIFTIFFQGVGELYKRCKPTTNEPIKREHELYRQFIQLLMTYYTQEHEVSFYAKKCGVTPAHFSGAIRKASGHSPLAIITGIIIMNAKAQLKSTRLPVKEIAFSLGFNNLSFFNKY
ncbi:AraC family transcriptional regulator, partial [Bacteroides thetaiotaomicron]